MMHYSPNAFDSTLLAWYERGNRFSEYEFNACIMQSYKCVSLIHRGCVETKTTTTLLKVLQNDDDQKTN